MEESCWIEAMQEEIHEFERIEVWELVPRPDKAMIINLNWIFKVKLDEYGDGFEDGISERDFKGRGVDVDHASCQDSRRSTSGSAQFLGEKLVSWSSKNQKCIAISTTEAESGFCA
ncbi:hypothetical protein Tco_0844386 [Tanacetum coccineum]